MSWLAVLGSLILYQSFAGTVLVAVVDPVFIPDLAVLWVAVLADKAPASNARAVEDWIFCLVATLLIGALTDLSQLAPTGLHGSVYLLSFFAQRLAGVRVAAQAVPLRVLSLSVIVLGVHLLLWWVKGLSVEFAAFPPLRPALQVVGALMSGAIGALALPWLQRGVGDAGETAWKLK